MSLAQGFHWSYQDWHFTGYSLAGISTSLVCKNASICFDVGQGLPFQFGAKRIVITHGHMDHASGLPYLIAQKNMMGQKEVELYLPPSFLEPFARLMEIWQGADGHQYSYRARAALAGELYQLDRQFAVKPFPTVHRVPSQGYLLYQRKKRLRAELKSLSPGEIVERRRRGEDPNEETLEPVLAFTGDTQIEFLGADPDVAKAKMLFVECSFWDDAKPVAHAREWGHTHFDEILAALPRLQNEKIVLLHTSVRYSPQALGEILAKRLPVSERERVVLFPRGTGY